MDCHSFFSALKYLLTLCLITGSLSAFSQKQPVRVQTSIAPPYSVYLSDYFALDNNQLRLNLLFTDLNEPSWDVKLRFTIEGDGLRISTDLNFIPDPINLTPGAPSVLYAADLAEYLDYNHLTFAGAHANELLRNGRLKEGFYRFCFEALDHQSGKPLSQVSCASVWIMLKEPPYLITPVRGTHISTDITQNISFQWQMANEASVNPEDHTEYQLSVFEVTDANIDPMYAISSNKVLPVFTSDWITQTRFVYDMGAPTLDIGKKYVYRVQARNENGLSQYKNNGFSEAGWFYYGYPINGRVALNTPENHHAFSKTEPQKFKWTAPDNLLTHQQFNYQLKIVTLEANQVPEQAMESNPAWHEETSVTTSATHGKSILLSKPLLPNESYAWQVKAFTGQQEIAASPVYTFDGPPILDAFYAGKHFISVKSTKGTLDNLSGIATVPFGNDEFIEVPFEGISVEMLAGNYVLRKGELTFDLSEKDPIDLTPDFEPNGSALFHLKKLKLNKDNLTVLGQLKWPLPHPVASGEIAYVTSRETWVDYNELALNGLLLIKDNIDYNLLDPANFTLSLYDNSDFLINNNRFKIRLNGHISLPTNIKASEHSNRISYTFRLEEQLYDFEFSTLDNQKAFDLGYNTGISIQPNTVTIDLSETASPGKWINDPGKKGLYLREFDLNFPIDSDKKKQLLLAKPLTYHLQQDKDPDISAWIGGAGLDLTWHKRFTEDAFVWFNRFSGKFTEINLIMSGSRFEDVRDNYLKGIIAMPFFSITEDFAFTIPVRNGGFMPGDLDQSLVGRVVTFSEGHEKEETSLEVVRAKFSNKDHLALTVNMGYKDAGITLPNVTGLKLWGDGNLGFSTPNGAMPLSRKAQGLLSEKYELEVDSVRAIYHDNTYALGIKAGINLGNTVSSPAHGLPRINLISGKNRDAGANNIINGMEELAKQSGGFLTGAGEAIDRAGELLGEETYEAGKSLGYHIADVSGSAQDLYMTYVNGFGSGSKNTNADYVWTVPIAMKYGSTWGVGVLNYVEDHSEWGDFWQGFLHISMKEPFEATLGGQFVTGEADNTDYWLLKLFAKSKDVGVKKGERGGVKLGPLLVSEFRGTVYHHMRKNDEKEIDGNINDVDESELDENRSYNDFNNDVAFEDEMVFENNETFDLDRSYYGAEDFLAIKRQYLVDKTLYYGGSLRLQAIDAKTKGDVFTATLGADLEYNANGSMRMLYLQGSVGLSNDRTTTGKRKSKISSDFIGGGSFYYKPASGHIRGTLNIETNSKKETKGSKKPVPFCLKANATFEADPTFWQLDLGNRFDRIIIDKGCAGMKYQGWLGFGTERLDAGLGILFQKRFESGWIDLELAKFNAAAEVGFQSTLFVGFDLKPEFRFREGGVEVEAWANVKIDYQSFLHDGSLDLVDARLRGLLLFKDVNGVYHFHGSLNGHAKVLGVGVGFELNSSTKM